MTTRFSQLSTMALVWLVCANLRCMSAAREAFTPNADGAGKAAFAMNASEHPADAKGNSFDEESEQGTTLGERDRAGATPAFKPSLATHWGGLAGESAPGLDTTYALDGMSRLLRVSDGPQCHSVRLVSYDGGRITLNGAALVNANFRERLQRFEEVVSEVALGVYGRVPVRILHRGAFACRSRRGQPTLLSEHALGNAIDVSGFEFGPALAPSEVTAGVPAEAFRISVARHWHGGGDPGSERDARFLHSLIARLIARGDVFRGIITPADPAHFDHFHFDMAPGRHLLL